MKDERGKLLGEELFVTNWLPYKISSKDSSNEMNCYRYEGIRNIGSGTNDYGNVEVTRENSW